MLECMSHSGGSVNPPPKFRPSDGGRSARRIGRLTWETSGVATADTVTLKIPRQLYDKLGLLIEGTGFRSVTEFVVFVMRDLAGSDSQELDDIKARLEALGYL